MQWCVLIKVSAVLVYFASLDQLSDDISVASNCCQVEWCSQDRGFGFVFDFRDLEQEFDYILLAFTSSEVKSCPLVQTLHIYVGN